MKILYLTQFFSSTRGGGPLIFYDLAKRLSQNGHEIYVICNVATETIDNKKVTVFTVKPSLSDTYELPPSPFQNLRYITNSLILGTRIIKKNKIDIIHTNSFTPVIAGSILSKILKIPMIASIYDVFTDVDKSNWRMWTKQNNLPQYYSVLGRIYEQISLHMPFNLIHTISSSTRDDILLQGCKTPVRVIYPAIDGNTFANVVQRYEDIVVYIGRLVFYKNVNVLIRAYKEVIKEFPKAQLIIVGEGPMREEWRRLAQSLGVLDNVYFTGHISQEDKINILSRSSALALPSVFEGFGLVILEAFAMAKPVLVPNIHPFDEIVDNNDNGFLLPSDDAERWAKAIITLLSDKRLSRQMGYNAANKFKERYDFSKYMQSMESLYQEIMENSRKHQK